MRGSQSPTQKQGSSRRSRSQVTCSTGTKVQTLTQLGEQEAAEKAQAVAEDETTAAGARAAAAEAKEQAEAQVCYYIGVLVLLYTRPSTTIYVSSYRTTIAAAAGAKQQAEAQVCYATI